MTDKISNLSGFITKDNLTDGMHRPKGLLFNNVFDEPTYLSIRVDFFPDVIDKNDQRFLLFNSPKENNLNTMSYNNMPCPLLDRIGDYSTYKYLNDSIGDVYRAHLLQQLIKALADLSVYCPYYITSIDGINDLLSIDPKRGTRIKNGTTITLKCIEGLDQRISAIKNMYKKIVWDDTYQRWVLPDMMRFFKMNIYITEFRVFHTKSSSSSPKMLDISPKISNVNTRIDFSHYNDYKFLNSKMPTTVLTCSMCEFDISDSFSHLSTLSSSPKNNSLDNLEIKIKVGNINEHSIYGLFTENINNDTYDEVISLNDINLSRNNINSTSYNTIEDKNSLKREANINYYLRVNQLIEDTKLPEQTTLENSTLKPLQLENKRTTYFGRVLKNATKGALGWAKNHVKDQVIQLINKKILNGSSLNDIRRAIKSENIYTMYSIFKSNAENIKAEYPEVSAATNGKLDVKLFEEYLNMISSATTVNENDKTLIDAYKSETQDIRDKYHNISDATNETAMKIVADYLISYGNENSISSIDDYMNALKDLLDDVQLSKATTEPIQSQKILL